MSGSIERRSCSVTWALAPDSVTLAGASAHVTEQLRRSIEADILEGVEFA